MKKKIALLFLLAVAVLQQSKVYALNGEEQPLPSVATTSEYGANILRLAPMTAIDVGVGFGVSYERLLGKEQKIGLVLPVAMILENRRSDDISTSYNDSRFNKYVYFTPGIKIYPFGQRKINYAAGANLMVGYGGGNEWQYRTEPDGSEYLDDVKTVRWRLGFLVSNYVNFQISKLFNLGLEGGLGVRYLDRISYSGSEYYAGNGELTHGFDITGQFALTLGLRF